MYKRRGGLNKTIQEIKLQQRFLKMGFINKYDFFLNLFVRGAFRLLPNFIRGLMYKKLLGKMS
ncbi:UDP-Gal:alpha-D-GlcNAc-diphosphoundecaprenol beta-1,3-galactosyltransferase [compost metagenome]